MPIRTGSSRTELDNGDAEGGYLVEKNDKDRTAPCERALLWLDTYYWEPDDLS